MRILMFGRGTISTIYGKALQDVGHHVEFYVRPGRTTEYGNTLQMDVIDTRRKCRDQHVRDVFQTTLREDLSIDDGFDLIIISVGHHRLTSAIEFLASRIGNATVLVFGNVWEETIDVILPLPAEQVVFGFPQAGGGFDKDGVLHGALFGSVIVGQAGNASTSRELAVGTLFSGAGFKVREQPDMRGWLYIHFVSDAGMFAQAVRSGSMAHMIGDRTAFRHALLTSRQILPLLEARGVDLRKHRRALLPARLPGPVSVAMAIATKRVPIARVSLAAHTDPDAAEPRAVLRDTFQTARRLNVPVPLLATAIRNDQ